MNNKIITLILFAVFSLPQIMSGQTFTYREETCGINTVGAVGSVHSVYNPVHVIAGKTTTSPGVKLKWIINDGADPF